MCRVLRDPFGCIVKGLYRWLVGSGSREERLRELRHELFGLQPPRGDFFMLEQPVEGSPFHALWDAMWLDATVPMSLIISLAILLTGRQIMSSIKLLQIAGMGSQSAKRASKQSKAKFRFGLFAVILAYPTAAIAVSLSNYIAMWFLPGASQWGQLFSQIVSGLLTTAAASAVNPYAIVMLVAFVVLEMVFEVAIWIHDKALFIFLYGLQPGLAIKYSGIPVLSEYVDKLLRRLVPLLVAPVAIGITVRGFAYFMLQDSGGFIAGSLGLVGPVGLFLMLDYVLAKILMGSVPGLQTAVQKTVGVAAAAGTLAAGGSGIAISQAYRGNFVRAGIYATQPDFDHAPADRDEVDAD